MEILIFVFAAIGGYVAYGIGKRDGKKEEDNKE